MLRERQVKNLGMAEKTVLSLSYGRVIVKPEEKLRGLVPESFETYQIVEPGNIIIRPTDLQNDQVSLRVGQVKDRGIITSAYLCLEAYGDLSADYAHLLLLAYDLKKVFYGLGSGLRQNLSWNDFRRLPIPLPSRLEQEQIVRFVRQLDSRVNRLIKAKRRLIELLNEQASVVTLQGKEQAVVEREGLLLSEIPATWEYLPAKRIFEEIKVTNHPDEQLLAATQDRGVLPKSMCEQNYVSPSGDLSGLKLVLPDDFVISLRSFQGGIEHSAFRGLVSPAYNIIRLRPEYRTKEYVQYYRFLLKSPRFISLLNTVISGIRDGKNILFSDFGELVLPIPSVGDVETMMPEFSRLDRVKKQFANERKLIEEYRTRLVADVVTGQLDVRQHPWANTEIEDSTEAIAHDAELEDDLEATDDVMEEAGI